MCIAVVPHQEWKAFAVQENDTFCPFLSQEQSGRESKVYCWPCSKSNGQDCLQKLEGQMALKGKEHVSCLSLQV